MDKTITLHLGDTDMIVFCGLIENKMESLRRELFQQGLKSSKQLEELKAIKDQFLNGNREITSYNTF